MNVDIKVVKRSILRLSDEVNLLLLVIVFLFFDGTLALRRTTRRIVSSRSAIHQLLLR
jgi:hypothetical protein